MTWLYNLFAVIFILFYFPVYLVRGKFHRGFLLRLGFFPPERLKRLNTPDRRVWFHAVSVGEVNAISHLIEKFRRDFPDFKIVISTVTPTGNRLARTLARQEDLVIYLPLDLSFITERFIRIINPALFFTTETELWPNLISGFKGRDIPVILVNGRISLRSFRGYGCVKFALRDIFAAIRLFCMQSQTDAERIIALGAQRQRVRVTGNMKFDIDFSAYTDKKETQPDYAQKLKSLLGRDDQLIVAGSTHQGEEKIMLRLYVELLMQFEHLKILVAPRHIERVTQVEKIARGMGLDSLRVSDLREKTAIPERCVLILDTIGHLKSLYGLATIVFVGGSLIRKGGHNIIEPAFFAKPVVVGPFMFNFSDITAAFLERQAVIQVDDELELLEEIKLLLLSPAKRESLGRRARETITHNRGATAAAFDLIKPQISGLQ